MIEQRHRHGTGKWALLALGGAILLMLLGWLLAASIGPDGHGGLGSGRGMMSWGPWAGAAWPAMAVMILAMLLFWVAVIFGLVALFRGAGGLSGHDRAESPDALETARRRYARGELTHEEYQRLRRDLE